MSSLRIKIFLLFCALLLVIESVTLVTIYLSIGAQVDRNIHQQLNVGHEVFVSQFESRREHLSVYSNVIARDYGLLSTLHDDPRSLQVALDNHRNRVGADLAVITDLSGSVLADTERLDSVGQSFVPAEGLLAESSTHNRFLRYGQHMYQLVTSPIMAPNHVGNLYLGFVLDDDLARQFESITSLQVSFVTNAGGEVSFVASTAQRHAQDQLAGQVGSILRGPGNILVSGETYISLAVPLERDARHGVVAILQQSRDAALAAYQPWWQRIAEVSVLILLAGFGGAWLFARSVVRPVRLLAQQADAIAQGNYDQPITIGQRSGSSGEIGELVRAFGKMQSAIAEREESIRYNAYHDPQTGLVNRYRLEQLIDESIRQVPTAEHRFAVLAMDLARFKDINDTLGYHVGDRLLYSVGQRLAGVVGENGIVARLGGDEFGLLVPDVSVAAIKQRLEALLLAMEEPFHEEGLNLHIGTVIGVAVYPEHGHDAGTLLRNADAARYLAKEKRTRYELYAGSQDRYSLLRVSLLGEMQTAMENGDMRLHYQPKLDLRSGMVEEIEALLRWHHPTYGMIPPQEFISMVENTGNIHMLTRWVIVTALQQVAAWARDGLTLRVAVNISAHDLLQPELIDEIRQCLQRTGTEAAQLRLEVTESAVVENESTVIESLRQLHELGVVLSIDDYGTGYSSLAQLKRLPVNELKIDKSFVIGLTKGSDDEIIVRSTIELGHLMGLDVCAEGVESAEVMEHLHELGCETVQGYHIGKPMPPDDLVSWLRQHIADATP